MTLVEDGIDRNRLYACGDTPHVWIGFSEDVTRGTTLYPTGVVVPGTRVNFHFFNPAGQLVARHLTQPARANCVIHHEPEAMSTAGLSPGYYFVYASYWSMTGSTGGFPVPNIGALIMAIRVR